MSLQERLKELFEELRLQGETSTAIAKEVNLGLTRVSEILNNLVKPSPRFLLKLSQSKRIQNHFSLNEAETASMFLFWYLNEFYEHEKIIKGFEKVISIEK